MLVCPRCNGTGQVYSELLTNREHEITLLAVKGYTYKEIGKMLYITPSTVKNHVQNIYQKLNVQDSVNLLIFALKNDLISLDELYVRSKHDEDEV